MGNKDKSLKRCYKKKKVFHSNRYTQITAKSTTSSTPVLAGTIRNASTSYDSSDASTSLSARRLKLNVTNRDVSDNESHFDSNGANIYKIFSTIHRWQRLLMIILTNTIVKIIQ